MAFDIIGKFVVQGTAKASKEFDKVTSATGKLNKELGKNREGMQILDKATGGAISSFGKYKKALVSGFTSVKALTKGMKLLKVAMISSGIGAIVVLVAALVANMDKFKALLGGASLESQKLAKQSEEVANMEKKKLDALNGQENILKLQGKSEKEIIQMKAEQTKQVIIAMKAQIKAQEEVKRQQVASATRNQKILSGMLKFVSLPLTAILKAYDTITGSNTSKIFDDAASLLFDPAKVGDEADETLNKTKDELANLENQLAGYELNVNKIEKDARDKRNAEAQKDADEKKAEEEKRLAEEEAERVKEQLAYEDFLKRKEEMEDKYFTSRLDKETQEKNAVADKYFALIEEAEKYGEDTAILEEARRQEMQDITDRYDQEELEKQAEKDQAVIDAEQELADVKREIKEKAFDDAAKIAGEDSRLGKAIYAAKQIMMLKENMMEQKKTLVKAKSALAEAKLDAAKSGTAVAQGTGETSKIGFPQNVPFLIAYALQAVGIVKAIKGAVGGVKKEAAKVGAGGGGDTNVGTPQATSSSAPAFNMIAGSQQNQIADAMAQSNAQPFRAYVVSNDVTSSQELERNAVTGSSIG